MTYALPIKTAHYVSGRTKHVIILDAGQPFANGVTYQVTGKAEARAIARKYQAKCWNF